MHYWNQLSKRLSESYLKNYQLLTNYRSRKCMQLMYLRLLQGFLWLYSMLSLAGAVVFTYNPFSFKKKRQHRQHIVHGKFGNDTRLFVGSLPWFWREQAHVSRHELHATEMYSSQECDIRPDDRTKKNKNEIYYCNLGDLILSTILIVLSLWNGLLTFTW